MCLFFRYKHFYAKGVSTHPSMVSRQQHRFNGKMCKNVETVSTRVKSVSTRVAVFQKSVHPGRHTLRAEPGQQVDTLTEQVDTGPSSQNNIFHILGSVSTPPPGQVDTLRKDFILKWMGATCQPRPMGNQPRIVCPYT
ncbi:hypothetical protein Taro_000126, partial [Colocasia esculenta]|nr:hypothetical protein [Colocasia esculenta]